MEDKTVQLRAKPKVISQYGQAIFYETQTRARFLLDTGQFELVNIVRPLQPSETKPTGPSEFKAPVEKKYSPIVPAGRSIDSAPSIESGTVEQSASSGAGQALPLTNAQPLVKRGRGRPRKV